MPCCFAQATIGAACAPVLTLPSPISPTSVTPAAAISAKSCSSRPELEDRRAGVDLHAGGPQVRVRLGRDDRERLQPDDVLRPARQVDLAGRDHRGHAAVQARLDEVDRLLARREVAEDRVGVGVDQAGNRRRALGVDRLVERRPRRVAVEPAPDGRDPAVLDQDRVGVRERRVDVAGDERPDVA